MWGKLNGNEFKKRTGIKFLTIKMILFMYFFNETVAIELQLYQDSIGIFFK